MAELLPGLRLKRLDEECSVSRQLVVKDVRVGGHDGVADFDCPPLYVEGGTDQPEHRHPWRHRQ